MTEKIVAMGVYDRFMQLGARLLDFQKYLNVKMFCSALVEAVVACACSCFPPMDTYIEDGDITPTEQKKIKQK